jgi:small-conductance mechanosensitive channel
MLSLARAGWVPSIAWGGIQLLAILDLPRIGAALGCFVGGVVVGFAVYKLISARIRRSESITRWGGSDLTISAVRDVAMAWFAIGGLYGAVAWLPISTEQRHTVGKALLALVILSATFIGARVTSDAIKVYALRTGGVMQASSIFITIGRLLIYIVGFLILLQTLGVSIAPILTALGVGGLAVALALQDTLANLFAGVHLLASKKIRIGDYVKLETGQDGYVVDINWRNTSIRQLPNNMIIVPNAKMASAIVTNFYRPQSELSVPVEIAADYRSDLDKIEAVTKDVIREVMQTVPGGVPTFEPLVRFHTFDDWAIRFTAILRVREFADQYLIKHEFVKRLRARYAAEEIEIPVPLVRNLNEHLLDGELESLHEEARRR